MPALIFEKRNHIAYLTMNRPEVHNSLNPEMLVSLAAAWKEIDSDDAVRATIVTGAGNVAFSAGADLGRLPGHGERVLHGRDGQPDRGQRARRERDRARVAPHAAALRHGHVRAVHFERDGGARIGRDLEVVEVALRRVDD